jgi:DNA-binding MarR family transcriptional regulator
MAWILVASANIVNTTFLPYHPDKATMTRKTGSYRLSTSFPYLLNRAGALIAEQFTLRLEPFGLTVPMYRVLASLRDRPDQRLTDLAEMTTIEISTLSRLIGTLTRKGLISRKRLNGDGRAVSIALTARGQTLVPKLIAIAIEFEDLAHRGRTAPEIARMNRFLSETFERLKSAGQP